MEPTTSTVTRLQQSTNQHIDNNNEVCSKTTEEQIRADEKELFYTLDTSKKLSDYLSDYISVRPIPDKYQPSLKQYIHFKNDAEFFRVFKEFIQSVEFNSILKDYIDDLNRLKQLIAFYLKDNPSCNNRQTGINILINKLKKTAEYEVQTTNILFEIFSSTRENIHIIVAVISKLQKEHKIFSVDTTERQQINHADITVDALTELIIEYCDMFDACWAGVSFRMLSLQQGLQHRLSGKTGIVCKVKTDLLTALSAHTEQQLIATGDRENHPGMSVHVIAYLNYQLADKFGIPAIKDALINDDRVNADIPDNPNKPTAIQVDEYKKTADIVLSPYNINLNLASNLLDSFNALIELYGGFNSGSDIAFSKEKLTQIEEQEQRFLFNDLNANVIAPINLLYETTNNNTLLINNLIEEDTIEDVDSYIFKDILYKLQGFTAQALSPAESQRLIIDIPKELNQTDENLAIVAIGSCFFWVVDKNQLAENQAVKLDLTNYIKLEVSHIPKNLVNQTDKYFYRSVVTQALQQTQDAEAIVDFIDRCDINEYLQKDTEFKQHINQIISNKIAINPELKDDLIWCIFDNGNYIENRKFKFSYAHWFIESTLCEPLATFFAEDSIDIVDFINKLSIKTILQFENKLSLQNLVFVAVDVTEPTLNSDLDDIGVNENHFNDLFDQLMQYGESPVILTLFHSGFINLSLNRIAKNGSDLLMILAKYKDTAGIEMLVSIIQNSQIYSINLNKINTAGDTALLNIAKYGTKADIEAIFKLNQLLPNANKITDLHLSYACYQAAYYGNVEILQYLVRFQNIKLNAQYSYGQTALMIACINGHTECIKLLLESDKDIGINLQNNNGHTVFMRSNYLGTTKFLKLLVESGKDMNLNVKDFCGNPALILACFQKSSEFVKILLENIKDIDINLQNENGQTALMIACDDGDEEKVKLILAYSKDINLTLEDTNSRNALFYANYKNHIGCATLVSNAMQSSQ